MGGGTFTVNGFNVAAWRGSADTSTTTEFSVYAYNGTDLLASRDLAATASSVDTYGFLAAYTDWLAGLSLTELRISLFAYEDLSINDTTYWPTPIHPIASVALDNIELSIPAVPTTPTTTVPEPMSAALVVSALLGLGLVRGRRATAQPSA